MPTSARASFVGLSQRSPHRDCGGEFVWTHGVCKYENNSHYQLSRTLFHMPQVAACRSELLYREHHDWLFRWLRKRLGCEIDAADLAHDTYVRMIVSGRLPGQGQARPFLVQVAKGLVIDLHRRRALERTYLNGLAMLPKEHAPSAEERHLVLTTLTMIDQALDSLPDRVRKTFLMSKFEGWTYAAIAERLGVSVATVRKDMFKAALACMAALESDGPDGKGS